MSWQTQNTVYVIMWQSQRSGGTYTELRKTERGKTRLLETLKYLGIDLNDVSVVEQKKLWKPDLTKYGKRQRQLQEGAVDLVTTETPQLLKE